MPPELVSFIGEYGYAAIFLLVFLQEIGVPNPVPNELVLLFSGYLASTGVLQFPLVFLSAVSADFIGTSLLYSVFYFSGQYILDHKPRWLPISHSNIDRLSGKISRRGRWGIFLGRLVPYLRGYVSVAAGLLQIKPNVFLTSVIVSALIWSGGYVFAGKLMGPYWDRFTDAIGGINIALLAIIGIIIAVYLFRYFRQKRHQI
ncbi:MAG: DedA family protein [Patescibacteria group bacterium]